MSSQIFECSSVDFLKQIFVTGHKKTPRVDACRLCIQLRRAVCKITVSREILAPKIWYRRSTCMCAIRI